MWLTWSHNCQRKAHMDMTYVWFEMLQMSLRIHAKRCLLKICERESVVVKSAVCVFECVNCWNWGENQLIALQFIVMLPHKKKYGCNIMDWLMRALVYKMSLNAHRSARWHLQISCFVRSTVQNQRSPVYSNIKQRKSSKSTQWSSWN